MPWSWLTGSLATLLIAVGALLAGHGGPSAGRARAAALRALERKPNIVLILTDDLSLDLLRYMPAVQALARHGTTFSHYFVSDSLCCPSRASLFTGRFPHNTGIYRNSGRDGGFRRFYRRGEVQQSFNLELQRGGYRTALMGKYLNNYLPPRGPSPVARSYVPPGWNEWDVAGWGYPEYDYDLNHNGRIEHYGHRPQDYLTSVLTRKGVGFIDRWGGRRRPFFLELATFAPHGPYVPAPRYADSFPGLTAPRPPSFDRLPRSAPRWLRDHPPLTAGDVALINTVFRQRVQQVQSVDDMLRALRRALAATHSLKRTIVVFSSDNGLHTGEYRLLPGKLTAFDTDIHVPLIAAGPGIARGVQSQMVENTDLAETFAALAGVRLPGRDGRSLVTLLHGRRPRGWRDAILVEHHGPDMDPADPDIQLSGNGDPTTYEAMRTPWFLYVEYRDGEREFYDLRHDPFELRNLAGRLEPRQAARLHAELLRLERCRGPSSCWKAGHVDPPPSR